MVENYKLNLRIIGKNNRTSINNSDKVETTVLLNLESDLIVSLLLGRLLVIISQNNLNFNNNCTQLAKDLGESLL